jgi:hypothetical protein
MINGGWIVSNVFCRQSVQLVTGRGKAPNMGQVPNMGNQNISDKEVLQAVGGVVLLELHMQTLCT